MQVSSILTPSGRIVPYVASAYQQEQQPSWPHQWGQREYQHKGHDDLW